MTAKIALKIICLHSECIQNAKLAVHFGKGGFQKHLCSCALGGSGLSIGRVNALVGKIAPLIVAERSQLSLGSVHKCRLRPFVQ